MWNIWTIQWPYKLIIVLNEKYTSIEDVSFYKLVDKESDIVNYIDNNLKEDLEFDNVGMFFILIFTQVTTF